ncbi:MAG: hypothetical protein K940chlam7_00400 [Chlamydiae bacterium]|nr:hypothetical protein [Chlamydiota bacterium]
MPLDLRAAVNSSPFGRLPNEAIQGCFSFLDTPTRGRLARVCQLFRTISEENAFWRPLYLQRWNKNTPAVWVGMLPNKWKDQVGKIAKADFTRKTFHIPDDPYEPSFNISDNVYNSILWAQGLFNEATHPKVKREPLEEERGVESYDNLFGEMTALIGLNLNGTERLCAGMLFEKDNYIVRTCEILSSLRSGDFSSFHSSFLENRRLFIKACPTLGWWLSSLLSKVCDRPFTKEQEIFFPSRIETDRGEWTRTRRLLQGCALLWTQEGKEEIAFITMFCVEKIGQHLLASISEDLYNYDELSDHCDDGMKKDIQPEESGDCGVADDESEESFDFNLFNINPSPPTGCFGRREFTYDLHNVELCLMEDQMETLLTQKQSALWWEKWADALTHNPQEPFIHQWRKGMHAYHQAFDLIDVRDRTNRQRLGKKMAKKLLTFRKNCSNKTIDATLLRAITTTLKQLKRGDLEAYCLLTDFVITFSLKDEYPSLLSVLRNQRYMYTRNNRLTQVHLLSLQLELHYLTGDFKNVGIAWANLCSKYVPQIEVGSDFFGNPEDNRIEREANPHSWLAKLIQCSDEVCQEVIRLNMPSAHVQIGRAYAFYRLGEIETSLKILNTVIVLSKLRPTLDKDDLPWLNELSQSNFIAVLIYSFVYTELQDLKGYFLESLKHHPSKEFFIYHNLAIRLYFEREYDVALRYIKKAIQVDPDEAEAHRILGLIYHKLGFKENSQEEHDEANVLELSLYSCNKNYQQGELLFFPVEDIL